MLTFSDLLTYTLVLIEVITLVVILSDRRILHYEFGNIEIYNMIPIGSRIFTFLIGRFCEKIPYFMKNSYKQLANI